jgi:hypothetical protein
LARSFHERPAPSLYDTRIKTRSGDLFVIQQPSDERYGAQSNGAPAFGIKRLEQRENARANSILIADDYPEGFPVSGNIILGPVVFRLARLHRAGTIGKRRD